MLISSSTSAITTTTTMIDGLASASAAFMSTSGTRSPSPRAATCVTAILSPHTIFSGRPRAKDADERGLLLKERLFDDVLVSEGVVTHYLPLGSDGEKGIDMWLGVEAYELAIHKRFDVGVLVVCDGDFFALGAEAQSHSGRE